jgi:phosphopantothenoylcysteine decarboxylase/phosphopantothenate--cysteine ligase
VAEVANLEQRPFTVGFAAETQDLEDYARGKLERKNLDMIAANLVSDTNGFEKDSNELLVMWPGGKQGLPLASKDQIASQLIDLIADRYVHSIEN